MAADSRAPLPAAEKTTATLRKNTVARLVAMKKKGRFASLDALCLHLADLAAERPALLEKRRAI